MYFPFILTGKKAKKFIQRFFHNSSFWDLYPGLLANSALPRGGGGGGDMNNFRNFSFDTSTAKLCTHLCSNIFPVHRFKPLFCSTTKSVTLTVCRAIEHFLLWRTKSGKGNGRGPRGRGDKKSKSMRQIFQVLSYRDSLTRWFSDFFPVFLDANIRAADYFYFLVASMILCWSKHISAGKIIQQWPINDSGLSILDHIKGGVMTNVGWLVAGGLTNKTPENIDQIQAINVAKPSMCRMNNEIKNY